MLEEIKPGNPFTVMADAGHTYAARRLALAFHHSHTMPEVWALCRYFRADALDASRVEDEADCGSYLHGCYFRRFQGDDLMFDEHVEYWTVRDLAREYLGGHYAD